MVDIGSTVSGITSGINFSGVGRGFTILIIFLLVALVAGAVAYFVFQLKKYKIQVILFENIAGQGYTPTSKDRAMLVKIGNQGEEVLYLRRAKVYRTAYGKKMGKNTYWFAKSGDGYWINVTLEDLDSKMSQLGIKPVDRDMRYMHVAIRRNIKDRYEQESWIKQNIGLIVGIFSICIILIFMWLLFDKYFKISASVTDAIKTAKEVLETTQQILAANQNILHGQGVTPA